MYLRKVKKHPKMAKNILDFCNAGIARVSEDFFAEKFCNIKNIKNIKAKIEICKVFLGRDNLSCPEIALQKSFTQKQ